MPVHEAIVVDDGSDDGTVELIDKFARAAPFELRFFRNPERLGVMRNFERALALATGDLLFLADQDDVWRPEKVQRIVARFEQDPSLDLVFSDARLIDAQGRDQGQTLFGSFRVSQGELEAIERGEAFRVLLRRRLVTGATAAIRRRLLARAQPFPENWIHDEWLAIIAAATGQLAVVNERLTDYRLHGGNLIGVRASSLKTAMRDVRKSGFEYRRAVAARMEELACRLGTFDQEPGMAERVNDVRGKLQHSRVRASLPASRLRRIPAIARELLSGRYHRFSAGFASGVADLLEPPP